MWAQNQGFATLLMVTSGHFLAQNVSLLSLHSLLSRKLGLSYFIPPGPEDDKYDKSSQWKRYQWLKLTPKEVKCYKLPRETSYLPTFTSRECQRQCKGRWRSSQGWWAQVKTSRGQNHKSENITWNALLVFCISQSIPKHIVQYLIIPRNISLHHIM